MSSFAQELKINNVLQKIKNKLKQYPAIKYEEKSNSMTVFPSREIGFPVTLYKGKNYFMVSLKGWHEEFIDEEEALNCVKFALSDQCRLKVSLVSLNLQHLIFLLG